MYAEQEEAAERRCISVLFINQDFVTAPRLGNGIGEYGARQSILVAALGGAAFVVFQVGEGLS